MSTPYSSAGKSFKDLKQAQKARITDYMYLETQNFVSANGRIPVSVEDCETIVQKVCGHINIQISFDEVYKEYRKKRLHIIERLESNGLPEHHTHQPGSVANWLDFKAIQYLLVYGTKCIC